MYPPILKNTAKVAFLYSSRSKGSRSEFFWASNMSNPEQNETSVNLTQPNLIERLCSAKQLEKKITNMNLLSYIKWN